MNEYCSTFTIHGLTRIVETKSRLERFLWMILLAGSIAGAFFMGQSLIINFWKKAVYVSSEQKVTNNNTFPSVTFCLWPIANRQVYCNWRANDVIPGSIDPSILSCNKDGWWNELGMMFEKNHIVGSYSVGDIVISTEPFKSFDIRCPINSKDCIQSYLKEEYFRPLNGSPQCLTWNYNGYFSNSKNKIELELSAMHYEMGKVFVYIHDHRESSISTERYFPLNINHHTQIFLKKSVREKIRRHPHNDCENVYHSNKNNVFPGRYTLEACMDTFTCIQSLIKCGEVLDFCRPYIPTGMRKKYWKVNQTLVEVNRCMLEGYEKGLFDANQTICLIPCEKKFYSASFVTSPGDDTVVKLLFEERNIYEYSKENYVYVWQDVIAGVGGLIGLFCGLSILSIVEILTYFGLWFLSLFCKSKVNAKGDTSNELNDIPGSTTNYAVTF